MHWGVVRTVQIQFSNWFSCYEDMLHLVLGNLLIWHWRNSGLLTTFQKSVLQTNNFDGGPKVCPDISIYWNIDKGMRVKNVKFTNCRNNAAMIRIPLKSISFAFFDISIIQTKPKNIIMRKNRLKSWIIPLIMLGLYLCWL